MIITLAGVSLGFSFQLLGGNVIVTAVVFVIALWQVAGCIAQRHCVVAHDLVVFGARGGGCGLGGLIAVVAVLSIGITRVGGGGRCIVCSLGQRYRRFVRSGFGSGFGGSFDWRSIGVSSSISDGGIVTTDLKIVGRHSLGSDEVPVLIDRKIDVGLIPLRIHSRRSLIAAATPSAATPARIGAVVQEALAALLDFVFDLTQQCLAVRNRQLVVVGMDFGKGEKAVAVTAVVDKGRLQGRLNPCYPGQIDVGFNGAAIGGFVIDFLDPTVDHNHDPGFVTPGRVDKHFLAHHIS